MMKCTIFGRRVCVEKKISRLRNCYSLKIQIGRKVFFLDCCDPDSKLTFKWSLISKELFTGDECSLNYDEEKEILNFVRFLIVWDSYGHIFDAGYELEEHTTELIEWGNEMKKNCAYKKRVLLASLLGKYADNSASRMGIVCYFNGTVVNGKNFLLAKYKTETAEEFFVQVDLVATYASMKKKLGEVIKTTFIEGQNSLIAFWFVRKILPNYYMEKFLRP